ncbi:MAG: Asp-tRNA(Asn)/Glu-tRNA(Gln) amidotransferase subunit GatA [Synergistaceae bacterium]
MDFYRLSATEIAKGVKEKRWTAEEVLCSFIERIKKYDKEINSVVLLTEDIAIKRAKKIDSDITNGRNPGLLSGVPFLVKDNFCVKDIKTTCCSKMLEDWVPSYTATAVAKMEEAGAIFLGKTNMDEFAMGNSTESSIFGVTSNPRDLSRVSGGSSGGAAAAVAAGFAPISLGSDTGGSVRQPAAFCGVQGFKPSYGQISRYGVIAYASSLDQVGIISRSIEDQALVMEVIAKEDSNDTTCDGYIRTPFINNNANFEDLKGKKIGILKGYDTSIVDPAIVDAQNKTIEICKNLGAEIIEVELPIAKKHSVACYYMTALGDASSKLACYDGMRYGYHSDGKNLNEMYRKTRNIGFGKEVRHRILIGTCILTRGFYDNYYVPAMKVRQMIADEYKNIFSNIDAIVMPITASVAFPKGYVEQDKIKSYLSDAFTATANLAGLPSISLNISKNADNLPVNVQLIASRFDDNKLISISKVIEKEIGVPCVANITGQEEKM